MRGGDTARFIAVVNEDATLRLTLARGRTTIARRVLRAKAGKPVRIAVRVPRRAWSGRYAVRLVATDAAGNTSRTRTTHLSIRPR